MSVAESVADALRGRHSLLVLDNCEHVLDAVGELTVLVMASCPTVALLATSREPIGVPGEHVWAVPPLPPTAGGVELFCDRAAAADATFTPSRPISPPSPRCVNDSMGSPWRSSWPPPGSAR